MRCCIVIAISLLSMVGFCENADTIKVRGKGIGVTKTEALKDAYCDAVEQAVGLYVDAEQMVKNEELVKDQILTQSNGYIENYRITKEATAANGLVEVTILANVRKRDLTRKINDCIPSIKVKLSNISPNLHAQVVTEFKATDDAVAIIQNELKDLQPVKQLMRLTLADSQPIVERVKEAPSLARLWYPVKVEVDTAKYYKEFVPRWTRILDQIKVAPSKRLDLKNNMKYVQAYNKVVAKRFGTKRKQLAGVMTRSGEPRDLKSTYAIDDALVQWGLALNEEYCGMAFLDTRILGREYVLHGLGLRGFYIDGWSDGLNDKGKRIVQRVFERGSSDLSLQSEIDGTCNFSVGMVTSASGKSLSGRLYQLPCECVNEIVQWQHRTVGNATEGCEYRETAPEVECELKFADQDGNEVVGQRFLLRNLELMNIGCALLEDAEYGGNDVHTGGSRLWLITPLVGGFAKSYVKWVSVDVPKDDIAKIATASISVEE